MTEWEFKTYFKMKIYYLTVKYSINDNVLVFFTLLILSICWLIVLLTVEIFCSFHIFMKLWSKIFSNKISNKRRILLTNIIWQLDWCTIPSLALRQSSSECHKNVKFRLGSWYTAAGSSKGFRTTTPLPLTKNNILMCSKHLMNYCRTLMHFPYADVNKYTCYMNIKLPTQFQSYDI